MTNDRASEADDFPDSGVQVKDMAISVFELIDGHKGHTGTCLALMDQQKAYTLAQWNGLVANTMLVTHLFYRQVVEAVREESGNDADIRQWGAHRGGRASSLLCPMFILGRPAISNFSLDKDVDLSSRLLETEEDRLWVLETAIELLDGNLLKSPEAWLDKHACGVPLSACLHDSAQSGQAYLKVLPDVREARVAGRRRGLLRT
ncbi:hypothetical protein SELMODRAFT_409746 [Selaginella moellendorffii]|uniref:Uncharacterized protein n=1 Tax=Selaginella moellendorffii TaxID=88036 RepID=D8RCB4_SELML|nr:hypothetical protein SELMODRAFT_409746 [Selaginella moellendorffii]